MQNKKTKFYEYSKSHKIHKERIKNRIVGAMFLATVFGIGLVMCSVEPSEAVTETKADNIAVVQEIQVVEVTKEVEVTKMNIQSKDEIVIKAEAIVRARYSDSPFLQNNRLQTAFDLLGKDENKFKIFVAIAGKESAFGESALAKNCFNYWGYLYTGTSKAGCYSKYWTSPDASISRYIQLEGNGWLAEFDGTKASLDLYDSNHGNYCGKRDDCENWKKDIWWFISQFDK